MRHSSYEHVPNRIIPPHIPIDARRGDFDRRPGPPVPSMRAAILGGSDPYHGFQPVVDTYNGPVVDNSRRRGFDKGPFGEDLTTMGRNEGRQPLLRHPRLDFEHIGGEMEIARSRSASPEIQVISARSVRDDRRRDKPRQRRSSRSRSRDRGDKDHRKPAASRRSDRESTYRERLGSSSGPAAAPDIIRDGMVWANDNYFEFLSFYIEVLNEKLRSSVDRDVKGIREIREVITPATEPEKDRIVLPPNFNRSDRERMLHCDTTITGLPTAIFFGSGYGPREHYAKYSAAKDFFDKCLKIRVMDDELHAAIGEWPRLDRTFKTQFKVNISKSVNAVILLIKRMANEQLPPGFMTMRTLPIDIIDRFKFLLRMVVADVYYQGTESSMAVPKALETGYNTQPYPPNQYPLDTDIRRPSERPSNGPSAEEAARVRDQEIKEQVARELEKRQKVMEQEIRAKILEEERARIQGEAEREKKLELMKAEEQKYQKEKEMKEFEEQQKKAMMTKQVEDDFNVMVEQLEKMFVEVRSKGLNHILDMIYGSATFKTIQLYSSTLTSLSFEQKQKLVQDLRSLLDSVTMGMKVAAVAQMSQAQNPIQGGLFQHQQQQQQPMMSGGGGFVSGVQVVPMQVPMQSYQMPQMQIHHQAFPQPQQLNTTPLLSSSVPMRRDEVRRVTVGDMRLRSLSRSEQRDLRVGNKIIAQDSKTGTWTLATVVKIREDRVTVSVANGTWKKDIDDLYKEDDGSLVY
ncbi:C2H2-type domain-containing protein [Caenorhabditis elegans]|uniref:C2H2-type domain-containing protein n=1 Tax=Caenorhabditis elegans TaxID=6239 RepID=H2L071_CAEEL|nr:C2H2-type domain-containing protein [Caenorhabditis elegans]CCD71765.1 C2H2-type domain-containing protein [Caenorhabditis elegans]|eukprot:NP_504241.1 Uncharacterized protein CELE_Y61A9LA.3 [Caenorhabditis elegans]